MQQHLYYKLPIAFGAIIRKKGIEDLERRLMKAKQETSEFLEVVNDSTKPDFEREDAKRKVVGLEEEIQLLKAEISAKESLFCSLKESIAQKIHLILMTHFGEYRFDRSFGCSIWEHDFEILSNFGKWRDEMILSIQKTIEVNETRLTNIEVKVDIRDEEFVSDKAEVKKVKLRLTAFVEARVRETNDLFTFDEQLYVNPISLD